MSKDEFTKLFLYVEEMRKEMNTRFDRTDKKIEDLTADVDGLAGLVKDYHQELLMLVHRVDRLERWIKQIAKETGVKLAET